MSLDNLIEFPIYASKGIKTRLNEEIYEASDFFDIDPAKYLVGSDDTEFNGVLFYLTSILNKLITNGITKWVAGRNYNEGSVVVFNKELFVSLIPNNISSPNNTTNWAKVSYKASNSPLNPQTTQISQTSPEVDDGLPIGTILTIPTSIDKAGYINYEPNGSFSTTLYPELYKVLGTNKFATSNEETNSLPIGSLIHTLSDEIPSGWIKWEYKPNNLNNYPKFLAFLNKLISSMPLNVSRNLWTDALNQNTLPALTGEFYLKAINDISNTVGGFGLDTINIADLVIPHMYISDDLLVNPIGLNSNPTREELPVAYSVGGTMDKTNTSSILVAQDTKKVSASGIASKINLANRPNSVTEPKHLNTNLLIKVADTINGVPNTHKRVIKAEVI